MYERHERLMRLLRPDLVLALVLVFGGCDPTGPEAERRIEVRTDLERYRVGQDALLTITNRTGREIAYDFCTIGVERKIDGEWEPWGTFGFCLYAGGFLPTLAPGAHAMRNLPVGVPFEGSSSSQPILDSPLEAGGEYRVLVEVERTPGDFGTRARIGSNAFVVRATTTTPPRPSFRDRRMAGPFVRSQTPPFSSVEIGSPRRARPMRPPCASGSPRGVAAPQPGDGLILLRKGSGWPAPALRRPAIDGACTRRSGTRQSLTRILY